MSSYQQIRSSMKTGDVIAFSGKGRVSNIIKWVTHSHFSHVGIVLDSYMGEGLGKSILLVESTSLVNLADAMTGEVIKGVQLQWLSKRLEFYDGEAWWLPLKKEIPENSRYAMQHWLRKHHAQRTPYDSLQAMGAGVDIFDRLQLYNEPDFSSLFCSELVSKAFQVAGLLPETLNPSEQTPENVAQFAFLGEPIQLKN